MPQPPDLLLLSWNRREYLEKTLAQLLADPADFNLYCWDNGSTDGTAEVIAGLRDPRIKTRVLSEENVGQRTPALWFLDKAQSELVGKIDDDLLIPHGWTDRLGEIVLTIPRAGMMGCWVNMPEDWDEAKARHKIVERQGIPIFRNFWVQGSSFLAKRALLRSHILRSDKVLNVFPIDHLKLYLHGYLSGYPLPLILAHHMDDPRSPHYVPAYSIDQGSHQASFTARRLGFRSSSEYAAWIVAASEGMLVNPVRLQAWREFSQRTRGFLGVLKGKAQKMLLAQPFSV